ncbi:HNH endonuclease signature motif containing protein [Brevibacterium marinum]|uniref:HNH domain-containing protein n=1 Tax=Brevibacterium marinum TaxID=418643 RepID=A0A846S274_9MICO|nr:HNH endonuclease [Brevibacterium marinum]NJC57138.1 hypothetical protein [Brevibacterium marinum]
MKRMDDGNDDNSRSVPPPDGSASAAPNGRRLDIDEDSPFGDLLAAYSHSDQAQLAALDATSAIFVREVAHYLGLASPDLTVPYDFATVAETLRRHSEGDNPRPIPRPKTSRTSNATDTAAKPTVGHSPKSKRKKDRGAGRRLRRQRRQASESRQRPAPLPDFPAFVPTSTFNGWTHQYAWPDDISEYSALLGATTSGAYKHITSAMTLVHGLPKFHQRCSDGDFTIEHVAFVTRRCRDVEFRHLPSIDDYLADRRADITIETFKRSLALKIESIQPAQATLEKVAVRRRVDISTGDDGTAYLTLTGPSPELHACYRRVEAFARAVYTGNVGAFGDQLRPSDRFDDDRGIDALMLDILTRTRPQLKLRITSNNTTTGASSSTDFPIDGLFVDPDGVPVSPEESLSDYIERTFGQLHDEEKPAVASEGQGRAVSEGQMHDRRFADAIMNSHPSPGSSFYGSPETDSSCTDDGAMTTVDYEILLDMPTNEAWLSRQARTTITVPMLSLLNQTPGENNDDVGPADAVGPQTETKDAAGINNLAETAAGSTANRAEEASTAANVCDLAGMLPDGSPLPADMARRLAGFSSTWTRILTDPATGTPLDAKATSYTIPNSIRQTLAAQWMNCTAPGCTRRADVTEVDHIVPFDHDNPDQGGPTRFGNLHNLCRLHHQAKTDRKFSVRMAEPGRLEYIFKHGVTTEVLPPDNPINVEHARLFLKYFATSPPAAPPADSQKYLPTAPTRQEKQPTEQSQTGQPTTEQSQTAPSPTEQSQAERRQTAPPMVAPAEGARAPGWVEYIDPFSGRPDRKRWFWDSGEPPPF